MKKTILVAGLTLLLATAPAMAQMMGPGQMMGGQQTQQSAQTGGQYYPQYMNPGMMGGYGGYGMGPGMMGGYGYGMGPGMMGYYSPEQYEKQLKDQQEFLDATKELRKKMHDLKFDYAEALRNPKTEQKDLEKMNAEMENIWKQIYEKRESGAE